MTVFSVGRVQTPTLTMLVERELEIISHRPESYSKVEASFKADDHQYTGTLHLRDNARDKSNPSRIFDSNLLEDVSTKLKNLKNTKASASELEKFLSKNHIYCMI